MHRPSRVAEACLFPASRIVLNTLYLVVGTTAIDTLVGLGLAVLMEGSFRGLRLIRTLYLLPIMTAPIVVALCWRAMFNNDAGWINYALKLLGLPQPVWLGNPALAMPAVIISDMWTGVPFQAVLLLAACMTSLRSQFFWMPCEPLGSL